MLLIGTVNYFLSLTIINYCVHVCTCVCVCVRVHVHVHVCVSEFWYGYTYVGSGHILGYIHSQRPPEEVVATVVKHPTNVMSTACGRNCLAC